MPNKRQGGVVVAGKIAPIFIGVLIFAAVVWGLRRARRRGWGFGGRPRDGIAPSAAVARVNYRRLVAALAEAGLGHDKADTPDEVVERLRTHALGADGIAGRVDRVVHRYQAVRFGNSPLRKPQAQAMRAEVDRIAKHLKKAA